MMSCFLSFSMGVLAPQVPRRAEPLLCSLNSTCPDGECEYLHINEDRKSKPCVVPQAPAKFVVCAGPERSGFTWLFNALRFLMEGTEERVHSYWMHQVTQAKLVKRGVGLRSDAVHVLVKTHKWSDDWDPTSADLIVLTERDICGVVNSYSRVGWKPKDMGYLRSFIEGYLKDHRRWRQVVHAIIQYDDIADAGGSELACVSRWLDLLQISQDPAAVSVKIRSLSVPNYGCPDPVTKLWPRHTKSSDQHFLKRPSLSEQECAVLEEHASLFLTDKCL